MKENTRLLLIIAALLLSIIPLIQPETDALLLGLAGRDFGETHKLTASDGAANYYFGTSVAISGGTAVIGAWGDDTQKGAVYVFVRDGSGNWGEQQKLTASDGAAGDNFGYSIAVSGNTTLIGAIGNDNSRGAVYVFVRDGSLWSEQQKLTASDGAANDHFGISVAIDGDTAVIGAWGDDSSSGAAYVFVRDGSLWSEQQKLIASDSTLLGGFGFSVAVSGDTAIIGAVGDTNARGAAYVFVRVSGVLWLEQQKLTASDGLAGDEFGFSVVMSDTTAVIGARTDDNYRGSAYVFARGIGIWSEQQKLTASDGAAGDNFGFSVALADDTAVIGAYADDSNTGAAYVFVDPELTPTATPTELPTETPTETATSAAATSEPTPTHTATATLESGVTELIVNGDFEVLDGEGKPDITPWEVSNASGDKAKCNKDKDGDGVLDKIVAYAGNCAFQFKGVVGEAGKLQQNLNLLGINPVIGDLLYLGFYAQSKGGAAVKAKVLFKFGDSSKTKINMVSSGTEIYTWSAGAGVLTNTGIVKAQIKFSSQATTGRIYIDSVSLLYVEGGDLVTPPAVPPTETTSVRLSGSTQ